MNAWEGTPGNKCYILHENWFWLCPHLATITDCIHNPWSSKLSSTQLWLLHLLAA
jgi:hypothetical protein